MAEQSKVVDKMAIVRSIHHNSSSHDPSSHLVQTGYYKTSRKGGHNTAPCVGSVAAKLRGANQPGLPAYVGLPKRMRNGGAAYLGNAYAPFEAGGDPNAREFRVRNVSLNQSMDLARLEDRRELLKSLDDGQRVVDAFRMTDAIDEFNGQAFKLVTGALRPRGV